MVCLMSKISSNRAHEMGTQSDLLSPITEMVQAFPDANHAIWIRMMHFKIIYGVEAYLVDDLKEAGRKPEGADLCR